MIGKLKLGTKFTVLLLLIFLGGMVLSSVALSGAMQSRAENEVVAKAEILMQTMSSVRNYTSNNIKYLLDKHLNWSSEFAPETVPAYSAREVFEDFRHQPEYKNFLYKEATLNPTNLRDQADEFETQLIEQFKQDPITKEIKGYRQGLAEKYFFIARRVSVEQESCLQCHSLPQLAPEHMLKTYGNEHGFGWKLGEIVAAQTIYVPASQVFAQGSRYLILVISIFTSIFALAILFINLLLNRTVVKPLKQLTRIAQKATNQESEPTDLLQNLAILGDEPGQLAKAFQDMKQEVSAREQRLKQAQAALQGSEEYFRSLIEQASDIIAILNSDRTIRYVSPAIQTALGYKAEAVIEQDILDFVHPQDDRRIKIFFRLIQHRRDISTPVELRIKHQDGSWQTIEAIGHNRLDDSIVGGFVVNARNITARKLTEKQLQRSEASIRLLHEVTTKQELNFEQRLQQLLIMGCQQFGLEVGILSVIEEDHHLVAALQTPEAFAPIIKLGSAFSLVAKSDDKAPQKLSFNNTNLFLQAYMTTQVFIEEEPYGNLSFASLTQHNASFNSSDEELLNLMGQWLGSELQHQHSEFKLAQARDEALAANRSKSEFLAIMSHEIRTPMNAVIGMTGLLFHTALTPQQQDFVETIRSSGNALLTLINDILDFSKIEAGRLEMEEQPFSLRSCLEEALDLVASEAAAKGLELAYLIDSHTPKTIIGDVTRVRQVLVNLLGNAVKFTKAGEIVVSVGSKAQNDNTYEIQFSVKDTGIGIPQERMNRLFQSFSQVDSSTTRKYGGTGLGLAISKLLSEMMGGTMWAQSQVGFGSTFHFTIAAQASWELTERESSQLYQLTGKQILIIDQNLTNQQILTRQTQSWGVVSQGVESGTQALDWLCQGQECDLTIVDIEILQEEGFDLVKAIRQQSGQENLPFAILTPEHSPELKEQIEELALVTVLKKPVQPSQLYNLLITIFAEKPIRLQQGFIKGETEVIPHETKPLRILLAEDNVVNQKVALLMLGELGYRADLAGNGLEVLEALHRQNYDVILMDVQMPEMDGLTAAEHICLQWNPHSRPYIIAMTANAMQGDRERCLRAGMDNYISKPISLKELTRALNEYKPEIANDLKSDFPEQQQQDSTSVLDLHIFASLRRMAGAKADQVIANLIGNYLEDAPQYLQRMNKALEIADPQELRQAVHSLRSSSANLGAAALAELCREVENIARSDTIQGVAEKLVAIEEEYGKVEEALHEETGQ
ncbi:MAG: DUF3365 domain-containing protein [Spirulinaceae cyanobacterium]